MASSHLATFLRRASPLARALVSTPLSPSQAALDRVPASETAKQLVRSFASAASEASRGSNDAGEISGVSSSADQSEVAVKGSGVSDAHRRERDRGRGYGIGRGRLSPFLFDMGPLFSARGERDLLNMMDDFFLTPSRFFEREVQNIFRSLPVEPPRLDINETNKNYTIQLQLPGLKKDEVQITVEDEEEEPMLRITAHHEAQDGDERRFWEDVDTRLRLPDETNPDDVRAEFKDGVLSIHVPKKEIPKKPEAKRIPIQG